MTALLRGRWALPAACLLLVVTILAAYSNAFQNSFQFDDSHVVEDNLYIRSIGNLPRFFRDASTFSALPSNATYRPLVTASLAVDYWIAGGLEPRQFHNSQLMMLVVFAVMVFLLFSRLLDDAEPHWWNSYAALAAAAIVPLHATTTETMNLMHARSELMSVMGVAASFLVYLYLPRARRTYLYLVPMFVGALAKSQAAVFGPLFLAYVYFFEQRLALVDLFRSGARRRVLATLVKALPAIIASVAVLLWVESMNVAAANYGGGARLDYLRTQFWVWLHYGRLFLWPTGLTADTDWNLITSWSDPRVLAGVVFALLLLRLVWVSSKVPSLTPVAFGIAWFGLALLPASSVIPLAEVANDHRVFFPYVGLSLAAVWGAAWLVEQVTMARPRLAPALTGAAVVLAAVMIFGNALGAHERNKVWLSEETLWRDVTEKSPANGRGWMNYGLTQMAQGRYAEAKQLFERAATYAPNYATLEVNLGIVSGRLGEMVAAEKYFKRALELRPAEPNGLSFYARWLVEQGRVSEAIPLLVRAVAVSPAVTDARHALMDAYARTGQAVALKAAVEDTLALAPDDAVALAYVSGPGPGMTQGGQVPAARTATDLLNTSLARYRVGDFQGSIDAAQEALVLQPDYPEAHNNIAAAYASLHRWDDAAAAAREALRLQPDFPLARNNLAWAEEESRKAKNGR